MTPCFFLQCCESPLIEQSCAALRTVGLSVQTYSFSANDKGCGSARRCARLPAANCGGCHSAMLALSKQGEILDLKASVKRSIGRKKVLTVAHTCATMPCVVRPPREMVGTNRATAAGLSFACQALSRSSVCRRPSV